jgi:hypothetical protein
MGDRNPCSSAGTAVTAQGYRWLVALMAEFPASEGDELVTKSYLRAELAELRTEIANLRSDLTVRMISVTAVATAVIVAFRR